LTAIEASIGGSNLLSLKTLRRRALDESLPVYLVGGPVRDALLGAPVVDLDFVVEGDALILAGWLAEELGGEVVLHRRFGTATVMLGDSRIDVVTARRETYQSPGTLPAVTPGTIRDDLARRDFTINALALPLFQERPEILDPHSGVPDLSDSLVRILHPKSFIDDPTRILRAVRYEQRLGFTIEEETGARLNEALAHGYMDTVSGDRLRQELDRILQEGNPVPALKRAVHLGVLRAIHPTLGDAPGLARLGSEANKEEYYSPLVYLAALVYRLSRVEAEQVICRLNFPGRWAKTVRDTIELRERESQLAAPDILPSQIYYLAKGLAEEAVIMMSRITDSELVAQRLKMYLDKLISVRPELKGEDLISMGVPEGPKVGQLLEQLREARLDRRTASREDERRLVRETLAREREQYGAG
jgi:tRNA nucleotidyltransferase (CCA-adding enzyme)